MKRVDVTRVADIHENEGTFSAQLFVQLNFPGGKHDPALSHAPGGNLMTPCFPLDANGVPTWRPNAAWYLSKLVFNNMCASPKEQINIRDQEVRA